MTNSTEKIFNVGSGSGHSLTELKQKLERLTGRALKVNYKTMQKVDVPVNVLDIRSIGNAMQWQPVIDIDLGMSLTWDCLHAK